MAAFAPITAPNDLWCIDFKGWFRTADGRRCDPLTTTETAKAAYGLVRAHLEDIEALTLRAVDADGAGEDDAEITGVAGIREARCGELAFQVGKSYVSSLSTTGASAVLLATGAATLWFLGERSRDLSDVLTRIFGGEMYDSTGNRTRAVIGWNETGEWPWPC